VGFCVDDDELSGSYSDSFIIHSCAQSSLLVLETRRPSGSMSKLLFKSLL
jgi:hypothetical protein